VSPLFDLSKLHTNPIPVLRSITVIPTHQSVPTVRHDSWSRRRQLADMLLHPAPHQCPHLSLVGVRFCLVRRIMVKQIYWRYVVFVSCFSLHSLLSSSANNVQWTITPTKPCTRMGAHGNPVSTSTFYTSFQQVTRLTSGVSSIVAKVSSRCGSYRLISNSVQCVMIIKTCCAYTGWILRPVKDDCANQFSLKLYPFDYQNVPIGTNFIQTAKTTRWWFITQIPPTLPHLVFLQWLHWSCRMY
jgi:hypothetical protein